MRFKEDALFTPSFICICSANLLFFIAFYMLIPVLPIYLLDELHATQSTAGIILATYTIGALVIRPFSGYVVDIFQRKPLYLLCACLFAVQFSGYLFLGTLLLIGILRGLHGMAFGMLTTSATTLAVDIMPVSKLGTGVGIYGVTTSVAMALGPMLGMLLLEKVSYVGVFIVAFGCAMTGAFMGALVRCDKIVIDKGQKISFDRFFLKKGTYAFIGLTMSGFLYGLLVNYLSVYARESGLNVNVGYFFCLLALGLILSRFFAGNLIDKGHICRLILGGKIVTMLGGLAFVYVPTLWCFFLSAVAIGLGYGMLSPSYQTVFINLAEPNQRGTANSTFFVAWDSGIGAAVLLGGLIAEVSSLQSAYLFALILMFLSAVLFMKVTAVDYERNRRK